jgi:hypothetical protein
MRAAELLNVLNIRNTDISVRYALMRKNTAITAAIIRQKMRRRFARDTQAMRSLFRRRVYIIVSRMPGEGKRDTSSESGQVNATEAVSNINRGPYVKGSI